MINSGMEALKLYNEGKNDAEIANVIDVPISYVLGWRAINGLKGNSKPRKYYTIYLNKDDEIVATGTAKECADKLGMTRRNFYGMIAHVNGGLNKRYAVVVDEI